MVLDTRRRLRPQLSMRGQSLSTATNPHFRGASHGVGSERSEIADLPAAIPPFSPRFDSHSKLRRYGLLEDALLHVAAGPDMPRNTPFDMLIGLERWTCWGFKHHSDRSLVHSAGPVRSLSVSALQQHARLSLPHGIE